MYYLVNLSFLLIHYDLKNQIAVSESARPIIKLPESLFHEKIDYHSFNHLRIVALVMVFVRFSS